MALASSALHAAAAAARHLSRLPAAATAVGSKVAGVVQRQAGSATGNAAEAVQAGKERRTAERDRVIDLTAAEARRTPTPNDAPSAENVDSSDDGRAPASEVAMPFPAYDRLSGDVVMRHVRDSDDVDHLRAIQAFEQAHKSRKGVLQSLDQRLEALRVES